MKRKYLYCIAAFVVACLSCGPTLAQWTTYQGDASHDGYVPLSLDPTTFSLLWQRSLTTGSLNPVTAGNGEVFVSVPGYFSSGMGLQALDAATGETKWSASYGDVFSVNPPAYANGKVYIQTCDHTPGTYLWAYDANTGAFVFRAPTQAQWESYYAPTIYDNTVYINGGYYGGMYGIDGATGQQGWFVSLNQYDEWTPAVDANYAYAYTGDYSPCLTVVERTTGKVAYKINDPDFDWNGWSMYEAVALGSHNDAFGINANRLICFDLQNKNIKWQLKRTFGGSGQATVAKGIVYAIDAGAVDAVDELTGNWLWSWCPPSGSLVGTVIATDTHLLASTADTTYAIDLKTHATAWSYPLGGKLALSNRALYVATSTGTLAAIAFPPSAITPVAPSALSIATKGQAGKTTLFSNANSIELSGTASELDSSGAVLCTGHLASVAWSNNRGGSGIGSHDSTWNTPTAWTASGIALKPGDNVITITATDLWGNAATTSVNVVTPTGLSVAISDPTKEANYLANTTPISLSGTASATGSSGSILGPGCLVSVTWSNDRGGSGTGTYINSSTDLATTWSATGIALKPGANVITVTAIDVWGNTATDTITVAAPSSLSIAIKSPTSQPRYTTYGSPIALSGTASELDPSGAFLYGGNLASITWASNKGGSGTGTYNKPSTAPTTWSITGIPLQGGDNVITVTATDIWGNTASAVITVTWSPGSIGTAKRMPNGTLVYIQNAVVTATANSSSGVFVESPDRSSGIKLVTNQALSLGDQVSFNGAINRVNGEYQISSVSFLSISSGKPLAPLFFTSRSIGNDRTESLNYTGLNTTGMLIKTVGRVTGTISTQQTFYIVDGGLYQDGVLPVYGIRVHYPSGVALPQVGKTVIVTGIERVEKVTLTDWGEVNGDWYPSGSILYVPSVWIRDANDIKVVSATP